MCIEIPQLQSITTPKLQPKVFFWYKNIINFLVHHNCATVHNL